LFCGGKANALIMSVIIKKKNVLFIMYNKNGEKRKYVILEKITQIGYKNNNFGQL